MIDTKEEYNSLLKHLRNLDQKNKLSKHLQSKLEGLEEVEQLINFVIPVSSLQLNEKEVVFFEIKSLSDLKKAYPKGSRFSVKSEGKILKYFVDNEIKHTRYL